MALIDFNLDEVSSLMQLLEKEAKAGISDLVAAIPQTALGDLSSLLAGAQRGLDALSAAHKKLSEVAKSAPEAAPAPEPAPAPAEAAPASESAPEAHVDDASEADTVALPVVSAEPAPAEAQ